MRHLSEGVLRRVHDDRFAASNHERHHLDGCTRCQERMAAVAADATRAAALFAGEPAAVDVGSGLAAMRRRLAAGQRPATSIATPPAMRRRRWAVGLVAVPVIAAGLVGTASAAGLFSIFSPTQVAPVTLTTADLHGLPDLRGYGTMRVTEPTETAVASAADASRLSGLRLLQPGSLPSDVPSTARWEVVGPATATFTLDSLAAAADAARHHHAAPSIPSNLDGTTVTVHAGPAVIAVYGNHASAHGIGGLPSLVIAEGTRPTATTNGASLAQLEQFLLAQPGVSPQLAAEIRSIGSPSSTLPIPIISGLMTSQSITIDGVPGVVAGDSSGLGSAVIWEKGGIVYGVGGLLPQAELVDIARSLH